MSRCIRLAAGLALVGALAAGAARAATYRLVGAPVSLPSAKHQQIRSILAGVLCGVISQRLLPRVEGGRVPAVEVMVTNSRIADLIREARTEEIPEAIADGAFFQMQTFTDALIELVLAGQVDREVASNAATNRHDFLVALELALKRQAADARAKGAAQRPAPSEAAGLGELRVVRPLQ